jgi:hypothetical protein
MKKQDLLKTILSKINKLGLLDEEVKEIEQILDDYLPEDKIQNTIDNVIYYIEKQYQNRYGDDEILVSYPISAKLRISLLQFKKNNNLSFEEYKKFSNWLVETVKKTDMNIWNLCNDKYFNQFKNTYSEVEEVIQEKKKINKKRLFTI